MDDGGESDVRQPTAGLAWNPGIIRAATPGSDADRCNGIGKVPGCAHRTNGSDRAFASLA